MRSLPLLFALIVALCLPLSAPAADAPGKEDKPRSAIVLASFGSTVKEARDVETAFLRETEKRYPAIRVVLANTSRMVMAANAKHGVHIPSVFRVLADLADEGYTHVAVQSLHLIPGIEFEGIRDIAMAQAGLPKGLTAIKVGAPLLASNEDCQAVAKALLASLPKERKAGEPVIFIGHGTHHGLGGMVYPTLQWHMAELAPNVFVSTIEGTPDREETLKALGKAGNKKPAVWVAPLLGLAGDHAVNDLYGDEDDSWKSVLAKGGWQVKEAFTPLYAIPAVRAVWFAHLDAALEALGVLGNRTVK